MHGQNYEKTSIDGDPLNSSAAVEFEPIFLNFCIHQKYDPPLFTPPPSNLRPFPSRG